MRFIRQFEELDPLMRNYSRPQLPFEKMVHLLCLMQNDGFGFDDSWDLAHILNPKDFPVLTSLIDADGCCTDNPPLYKYVQPTEKYQLTKLFYKTNDIYHLDRIIEFDTLIQYFYDIIDSDSKYSSVTSIQYRWTNNNPSSKLKGSLMNNSKFDGPSTVVTVRQSLDKDIDKYFQFNDDLRSLFDRLKEEYDTKITPTFRDDFALFNFSIKPK